MNVEVGDIVVLKGYVKDEHPRSDGLCPTGLNGALAKVLVVYPTDNSIRVELLPEYKDRWPVLDAWGVAEEKWEHVLVDPPPKSELIKLLTEVERLQ